MRQGGIEEKEERSTAGWKILKQQRGRGPGGGLRTARADMSTLHLLSNHIISTLYLVVTP